MNLIKNISKLFSIAVIVLLSNLQAFSQDTGSLSYYSKSTGIEIKANDNGSWHDENITFSVGKSGSSIPYRKIMFLKHTGQVGVGTTDPTQYNSNAKFTVRGGDIQLQDGAYSSHGPLTLKADSDNSGDDEIIFKNNAGTETMRIHDNDKVGIGVNNPVSRLHVDGDIRIQDGSDYAVLSTNNAGNYSQIMFGDDDNDRFRVLFHHHQSGDKEVASFLANGNVGIGTNVPSARFEVNGTTKLTGTLTGTTATFSGNVSGVAGTFSGNVSGANATFNNLTLNVGSFPDYVFAKGYKLMSLEQVEAYIKANHHLPNVPKAEKVIKEGMNVAQINVLLMEKVEELTLHTIEQNKQIKALMRRLTKLEKAQNKK